MPVSIRRGRTSDAAVLGDICYRAFKAIAEEHNFPADVPSPEVAAGLLGTLIEHDRIYDVVAEVDGRIAGSNFLDERNPIGGVGPMCLDRGLRVTQMMTLMTMGLYNEPQGAWLPSVIY